MATRLLAFMVASYVKKAEVIDLHCVRNLMSWILFLRITKKYEAIESMYKTGVQNIDVI